MGQVGKALWEHGNSVRLGLFGTRPRRCCDWAYPASLGRGGGGVNEAQSNKTAITRERHGNLDHEVTHARYAGVCPARLRQLTRLFPQER